MPPNVISNVRSTNIAIKIINELTHESLEENLLGVILDKNLSFIAWVSNSGPRAKFDPPCNFIWPLRQYQINIRAGPPVL